MEEAKGAQENLQEAGKKYFISNVNTFLGQSLVEELRNDHVVLSGPGQNVIIGTKSDSDNSSIPSGVLRVVKREKARTFRQCILNCDVIIYDLQTADLEEVDYVLKTLKSNELQEDKTLVLISTVMTWMLTPPKEKKEAEEGDDNQDNEGGDEEEPEDDDEPTDDQEDKPIKKKILSFTEKDYHLRVPSPRYQPLKTIETLAMSASKSQPRLKIYVLCAGILYGNGENVFYEHFKAAWLQNPEKLQYIGKGDNLIPTIHVNDLSRLVKRVIEKLPPVNYILAIDKTKRPKQKDIVQAISNGIGTGLTESVELKNVIDQQWSEYLNINLKMRPSIVFKDEEPAEDAEDPDAERERLRFKWHCEEGLAANITKLNNEFNTFRGLKPVKIFISGPPASGKTFYAKKLAEFYNIPHIHIRAAVEEAKQLQNELGEEIRAKIEEIKDTMVEELEAERKKKKGKQEEIDREKLVAKLPDDILYKIFQIKLTQNASRNRGYVLDGYPRKFAESQNLFLEPKNTEDNEGQENPDFEKYDLNTKIAPTSVIILKAEDAFLKQRVKELPEDKVVGTHFTEEGMNRRLKIYKDVNNTEAGHQTVLDFFKERGVSVFVEEASKNEKTLFESMKIYVERNGKPFNYMTFEQQDEQQRIEEAKQKERDNKSQKDLLKQKEEELEKDIRGQKEQFTKQRVSAIQEQERDLLDTRSQPIRQYLMDNVVPILTQGLIEVCKTLPEDPVDFLAEYLFKKSLEVPYPDPGAY